MIVPVPASLPGEMNSELAVSVPPFVPKLIEPDVLDVPPTYVVPETVTAPPLVIARVPFPPDPAVASPNPTWRSPVFRQVDPMPSTVAIAVSELAQARCATEELLDPEEREPPFVIDMVPHPTSRESALHTDPAASTVRVPSDWLVVPVASPISIVLELTEPPFLTSTAPEPHW
jgi:hypothetical protein